MQKKLLFVFAAMILGFLAGRATGVEGSIGSVTFYQLYSLVGGLFLNALTLVMVPLVAASIITGSYRMAEEHSFGRLGAKTFAFFLGTTAIALLIGWGLAVWMGPGVQQTKIATVSSKALELVAQASQGVFSKIEEILHLLIPSNILLVASKGQMLGLILFCLLFGALLPKVDEAPRQVLAHFWKGMFQLMIRMTETVMIFLPLGVFALVAKTSATLGWDALLSVGSFLWTVLLGLLIYGGVALSALLLLFGIRPIQHLRAMAPALLTAFSTSSSAATLPVSMECVEKNCGVSNRIASFALPLGTTVNLAGSSLQVIVSVFFIAQVYGIALPFETQCVIFFVAWLLSLSVAAIPSASLISIVVILAIIGLPADGIGLIMVVERVLDMCRTTVNVYSNSCCAVMVARSERESLPIAR